MTDIKDQVDLQWLSEQIEKYGIQDPLPMGTMGGTQLHITMNGKRYGMAIEEIYEVQEGP